MPGTLMQHVRNGAMAGAVLIAASALVAPSVMAQQPQGSAAAKKSAAKAKPKAKRLGRKQAEAELREGYRALQAKEKSSPQG